MCVNDVSQIDESIAEVIHLVKNFGLVDTCFWILFVVDTFVVDTFFSTTTRETPKSINLYKILSSKIASPRRLLLVLLVLLDLMVYIHISVKRAQIEKHTHTQISRI